MTTKKPSETPHYTGHRARLRERFLESLTGIGESNLPDYELLELALFAASPRADVKPLAKKILIQFGSFAACLAASPNALRQIEGLNEAAIASIKLLQAASCRALENTIRTQPTVKSANDVLALAKASMGQSTIEQFRVLYLDTKSKLIKNELQQSGTIDHTPVYIRELVKRTLDEGAARLILLHNHPSGDPSPSEGDIRLTREIVQALSPIRVEVLDHIIIGHNRHFSFAENGLM
jgi:DNA repair protein RadC